MCLAPRKETAWPPDYVSDGPFPRAKHGELCFSTPKQGVTPQPSCTTPRGSNVTELYNKTNLSGGETSPVVHGKPVNTSLFRSEVRLPLRMWHPNPEFAFEFPLWITCRAPLQVPRTSLKGSSFIFLLQGRQRKCVETISGFKIHHRSLNNSTILVLNDLPDLP